MSMSQPRATRSNPYSQFIFSKFLDENLCVPLPKMYNRDREQGRRSMNQKPYPDSKRARPDPAAQISRVLIIEDDRDCAESMSAFLQLVGFTVIVADTGKAALETISNFRPDAVLCDVGLPELDGFEVAR